MSEMPVFKRPFESNSSNGPPNIQPAKTIRLNIDLNQVNRDGSVVLNYAKLLNEEKARRERGDHSGKSDRDNKRLKLSYAELGAGYDDDDSFIDNTDAYEEGLPDNMDTKFGGTMVIFDCHRHFPQFVKSMLLICDGTYWNNIWRSDVRHTEKYYVNSGELELKKTHSRPETSTSADTTTESSEGEISSEEEQEHDKRKEPIKKDHDSSDSKKTNSDCDGKKKTKVINVPMKENNSKVNSPSIYPVSTCLP